MALADWNQWRGPSTNGISPDQVALVDQLPEGELVPVWTSAPIPSDRDGGHGSPISDGQLFVRHKTHVCRYDLRATTESE